MIPLDKIKKIIDTYKLLEKDLASGDISKKDFVKKSKEYSSIGEIINEAKRYLSFKKEKEDLEKIIADKGNDPPPPPLAKNELSELIKKIKLMKKF